jgi:hypothetical protein
VLLLICSVALNVILVKAIIAAKGKVPEPTYQKEPHLVRVAEYLGVPVSSGRSDFDIETDIKLALDDAPVAPGKVLSKKELDDISTSLSQESYDLLLKGCDFLEKVAGKRVWILKGRDF